MKMTVGDRIQLCRKATGISQKELGKRLGVSGSMIGQYENNFRKPKLDTLWKISSALNVSVLLLLGVEDASGNKLPEYFTDPEGYDIIAGIQSNGPTRQAAISQRNTSILEGLEIDCPEYRIRAAWNLLNSAGMEKVAERIEELIEIPRYRATPEDHSQEEG